MIDRASEHSFLASLVRRTPVVVDLGVNEGRFSRHVVERYGARVVGVEPAADLFQRLPELAQTRFEQAAITRDGGTAQLRLNADRCASTCEALSADDAEVIDVQGTTLEDLLDRHGVERAGLVKVDIEGAELELFESLTERVCACVDQFSVEFHDFMAPEQAEGVASCKLRLARYGFREFRFSRDNTDVLFVNETRCRLSLPVRAFIDVRYKNLRGLHRALARRREAMALAPKTPLR